MLEVKLTGLLEDKLTGLLEDPIIGLVEDIPTGLLWNTAGLLEDTLTWLLEDILTWLLKYKPGLLEVTPYTKYIAWRFKFCSVWGFGNYIWETTWIHTAWIHWHPITITYQQTCYNYFYLRKVPLDVLSPVLLG